eukprot:scaffold75832_cov39-Cyclotella_meneghiniana.AAC.2
MAVTAETSGGLRLLMRAHRRMPRGVGKWLVEGDGRIQVGCCVITAGLMIRGARRDTRREIGVVPPLPSFSNFLEWTLMPFWTPSVMRSFRRGSGGGGLAVASFWLASIPAYSLRNFEASLFTAL